MKIYLFGGAEMDQGQFLPQLKLIEEVILKLNPKQVLHIPFARGKAKEPEWKEGWFERHIDIGGIEYLNAKNESDIARAANPLVFLSGGGENLNLVKKVRANERLLEFIKGCEYLIGESAGAKVLGEFFRVKGSDPTSPVNPGLGIIKNTVIEPHYTQRNRQKLLEKDLKDSGVKYGLGVDAGMAVGFELDEYPENLEKVGEGNYELKINQ